MRPTVLFGRGGARSRVSAILNSGYQRNGTVAAHERRQDRRGLAVFGPVALAGLDVLQTSTGESLAPLFSRAIVDQDAQGRRSGPATGRRRPCRGGEIRAALALWTADERDDMAQAKPDLPEWLMNRAAEIWSPLLAIADAAGADWPDRARTACEVCRQAQDVADPGDDDVMADLAALTASWGE